jgi:hypothetical protein
MAGEQHRKEHPMTSWSQDWDMEEQLKEWDKKQ